MEKYSCYEYEIECHEGEKKSYFTDLNDAYEADKYTYKILFWNDYHDCEDNIHSDEWYDTEADAEEAAKSKIDCLENGPDDEPDYEARPYFEQSPEWWEERRKLGE